MQITRTQKEFVEILKNLKNSGGHHGLFVRSDTLLLVDVFNNF